jgi:hypothetical protein
VMMTSGRRPDDQGIRPYDHTRCSIFDPNAAILLRKNEIRARVLLEHFKLARILVGWRSSEDENLEIAICGLEPVTAPGGGMRCGGKSGMWAKGGRWGRKIWKAVLYGLRPLQPLEIPQNRQSFLWKSLAKTT